MHTLRVLFKNERYSEGAEIRVKEKLVRIEHITLNGFLYNHSASIENNYVQVVNGDKQSSYYSDWDYLEFVECEVEVLDL